MTRPPRSPRSVLRMGLLWALASGAVGVMVMLGFVVVTGSRPDPPFPLLFTVFGLISGVIVAVLLKLWERRR